jgi:sigma-B regulation protein RsbQ
MPDNGGDVPDATEPYGYPDMRTTQRNAVTLTGNQLGQPMVFAHGYGYGCDLSAPEETVDAIKAWL